MSFENKSRKWLSWKTLRTDAKAAVGILRKARRKANGSLDDYFREELVSRFACVRRSRPGDLPQRIPWKS